MTLYEGRRPPAEPGTSVLILSGPIARADVAALCERARLLLERSRTELVICDVAALVEPDAATVDALARLQLTARRLGCKVLLRHACGELQQLLAFAGLSDVLPMVLRVETSRQTEEREQPGRVEEEADPGDLTV
jgi:ABC-type transporter Mla MlaB component